MFICEVELSLDSIQVYFYNAKTRQTTWVKPEGQRVMSQAELDQLLASQPGAPTKVVSPAATETMEEKAESTESDSKSPTETPAANYNPYSFPPPSFGMPFGALPPHLMPHMAQMMQNGRHTETSSCISSHESVNMFRLPQLRFYSSASASAPLYDATIPQPTSRTSRQIVRNTLHGTEKS